MGRLRIFASLLSILSLLVAARMWTVAAFKGPAAAVIVAAALLAIVSPFDAPDPGSRKRVLFACLAYVGAMAAATVRVSFVAPGPFLTLLLGVLAAFGVGLSGWAFATRRRRRSMGFKRYFEN